MSSTVYIAIPNNGWIRGELSYGIHRMIMTSEIPVLWEDPQLSRGQPLASNYCSIVKRFLKTSCGHLLMIDNDEAPFCDLIELVLADKDIISCPARIMLKGKLRWSAYTKVKGGYKPVDLDALVDPPDFLAADAVGSGCIIIKRAVLEEIKPPFVDVFDADGIRTTGQDLEFCRRALEAGFEVFTTPKKRCEHFKCIGISDLEDVIKENV
jgi:GT2 family glycosyltransferase